MTATLDRRYVIAVTGLALEARIARGPGVRAVASGNGARRLRTLLEGEISAGAAAIISFGIAGGLTDHVASGTWVIGRRVVTASGRIAPDPAWVAALSERLPGALVADVAGSDAIVTNPSAKRAFHARTRACIVDTESHVVAELARAHGIPFAVFRVVSDPVSRVLPLAARVGVKAGGGVNLCAVLRSLVLAPAQVPSLARAAVDAGVALRALSRGRRRLGAGLAYPNFDKLLLDVA